MLSYHTCPLATLGGKDTGGMNVYVRELTRQLGQMGIHVDVFTRSQDDHVPHVLHELGYGNRVVHVPAGPEHPVSKQEMAKTIPQFVEGVKAFACEKGIRYDIIHTTTYGYGSPVTFGEHRVMFRPRDSHDQRVLATDLKVSPEATVRLIQDPELRRKLLLHLAKRPSQFPS